MNILNLNDTDLASTRRSIFIYTFFVGICVFYGEFFIKIPSVFSESSGEPLRISSSKIPFVTLPVLTYLSWRLGYLLRLHQIDIVKATDHENSPLAEWNRSFQKSEQSVEARLIELTALLSEEANTEYLKDIGIAEEKMSQSNEDMKEICNQVDTQISDLRAIISDQITKFDAKKASERDFDDSTSPWRDGASITTSDINYVAREIENLKASIGSAPNFSGLWTNTLNSEELVRAGERADDLKTKANEFSSLADKHLALQKNELVLAASKYKQEANLFGRWVPLICSSFGIGGSVFLIDLVEILKRGEHHSESIEFMCNALSSASVGLLALGIQFWWTEKAKSSDTPVSA